MKYYNLYYKSEKINNRPLLENNLIEIAKNSKNGMIYKKNIKGEMIPIQLKNIQIVECTMV